MCFERPGREGNFEAAQDSGGALRGDQLVIETEMPQARIGGDITGREPFDDLAVDPEFVTVAARPLRLSGTARFEQVRPQPGGNRADGNLMRRPVREPPAIAEHGPHPVQRGEPSRGGGLRRKCKRHGERPRVLPEPRRCPVEGAPAQIEFARGSVAQPLARGEQGLPRQDREGRAAHRAERCSVADPVVGVEQQHAADPGRFQLLLLQRLKARRIRRRFGFFVNPPQVMREGIQYVVGQLAMAEPSVAQQIQICLTRAHPAQIEDRVVVNEARVIFDVLPRHRERWHQPSGRAMHRSQQGVLLTLRRHHPITEIPGVLSENGETGQRIVPCEQAAQHGHFVVREPVHDDCFEALALFGERVRDDRLQSGVTRPDDPARVQPAEQFHENEGRGDIAPGESGRGGHGGPVIGPGPETVFGEAYDLAPLRVPLIGGHRTRCPRPRRESNALSATPRRPRGWRPWKDRKTPVLP